MTNETNPFTPPAPKQVIGLLFKFGIGIALGDLFCEQLQLWFPAVSFVFELMSLFIIVFGLTMSVVKYKSWFVSFNYGKALGFFVRMGLVIGLVKMVFIALQFSLINPALLESMRTEAFAAVKAQGGISKEEINTLLKSGVIETLVSAPTIAIMTFVVTVMEYTFLGLLLSIFHRKQSTPFA